MRITNRDGMSVYAARPSRPTGDKGPVFLRKRDWGISQGIGACDMEVALWFRARPSWTTVGPLSGTARKLHGVRVANGLGM